MPMMSFHNLLISRRSFCCRSMLVACASPRISENGVGQGECPSVRPLCCSMQAPTLREKKEVVCSEHKEGLRTGLGTMACGPAS